MSIDKSKMFNKLGKSGLNINSIVVGVMMLASEGSYFGVEANAEVGLELLKKCYDAGLRTFDTADTYANGKSEELLGLFIKKYNIPRDKIVILSKCCFPVVEGYHFNDADFDALDLMNSRGLSRKHIIHAAKASFERLGTYADVYQIHRNDLSVEREEIMRALNDIVDLGYTRYIGASSMKVYEFVELQLIAKLHGWHQFVSMQSYYSLIYREDEIEMNEYCIKHGVGLIPWSPLSRGVLARPVDSEKTQAIVASDFQRHLLRIENWEDDAEIVNRIEKVAKKLGYSMSQIGLAWLLHKKTNPIAGLSTSVDVDELVQTTQIVLSDEDTKYLEEPYKVKRRVV